MFNSLISLKSEKYYIPIIVELPLWQKVA